MPAQRPIPDPGARPGRRLAAPASLAGLVALSFTALVLPLIALTLISAYAVNRLSAQSEQTVYQAVRLTQNSLILMEELVTMERSARQYQVVSDPALLQVFRASDEQFRRALRALEAQPLDEALKARIERLGQGEARLAGQIEAAAQGGRFPEDMNGAFTRLDRQAYRLWEASRSEVGRRADVLRARARRLQQLLFWGALAVVAASLALGVGLSRLILRPVRQIDRAIHRLGDGDFSVPVAVRGPRDLEYLGERLDWTRRRLFDLEQSKQRFLRDVSHDLKTPLTTLLEGVSLLQEQAVGALNAEQAKLVRILHSSAAQLQRRIDRLLEYSRVQGQRTSLDLKALDLALLVGEALAEQAPALESRGLKLAQSLEPAPLWGDERKLRQVIDNLLSNGIKYAPRGSTLHVRVTKQGGRALLRLADQGPGVAEADRERLFDAFYRGAPPPDSVASGSGIGLAIVKEYVQAHRGHVRLASPDEGEGAVFEVCLPLDLREEESCEAD